MTPSYDGLSVEALRGLADDIATGRRRATDPAPLGYGLSPTGALPVAAALAHAVTLGMTEVQIAHMLRLLAHEREARRAARDDIGLVWTGPEIGGQSRDTQVVVRELFAGAERTVLIASYRIYQWDQVFGALVARMQARPGLSVRMYLHIDPPKDGKTEAAALQEFSHQFRKGWQGSRMPDVFYDPRTVRSEKGHWPSLHAKCIVVDGRRVLVTSANFTEAAQVRNIEVGVVLDDPALAVGLTAQFENLTAAGALLRVPGLG